MEQKFLGIFKKKDKKNKEEFEHKIIVADFLPIIEATLNGKKAYFLLDTGASISILNSKLSKQYGFYISKEEPLNIGGYGGVSTEIDILSNVKVYIGSEKLDGEFHGKDLDYLVKAIHSNTGYTISGIIGNNNIAGEKFIIDFKKKIIKK